jgi:hypothetical protein
MNRQGAKNAKTRREKEKSAEQMVSLSHSSLGVLGGSFSSSF